MAAIRSALGADAAMVVTRRAPLGVLRVAVDGSEPHAAGPGDRAAARLRRRGRGQRGRSSGLRVALAHPRGSVGKRAGRRRSSIMRRIKREFDPGADCLNPGRFVGGASERWPRSRRGWSTPGDAHGRAARVRALRDLPAAVSDLPRAGRGDGLAPRPSLPDARGGRGPDRTHADHGAPSRSLPRLSRVRDGVSRPACRSASCSRPRAGQFERRGRPAARRRASLRASSSRSFRIRPPRPHAPRARACTSGRACRRWCAGSACWRPSRSWPRWTALLPPRARAGRAAARVPAGARPGARPRRRAAGCVQRFFYPDVNHDTVRLLSLAGWDVVVPRGQGCCGALELHAGARRGVPGDGAGALAAALRRRRRRGGATRPGCGSAMSEYGHWLPDSPAARLAGRVRDVTEVLADADAAARVGCR